VWAGGSFSRDQLTKQFFYFFFGIRQCDLALASDFVQASLGFAMAL